jgi:peroxiredoxin Q/BCP
MSKDHQVQTGDLAPDFELRDQDGQPVRLSALLRDARGVVLYFYPKDETPGCTAEAWEFRDQLAAFRERGVEILGVSSDSVASHRQFADHHQLSFRLLSDADGAVRKLYGVPKSCGIIPGRVTYVIDRDGRVRHVFRSLLRAREHVREALGALEQLAR